MLPSHRPAHGVLPSWDTVKTRLDKALTNTDNGRCPCLWQKGWNNMIFKVPSNPSCVMLCCAEGFLRSLAHECLWLGWLESCVHVSKLIPVAFTCSLSCTQFFLLHISEFKSKIIFPLVAGPDAGKSLQIMLGQCAHALPRKSALKLFCFPD